MEFFYGADAHLDTLEKRLRSIYPAAFNIERVDIAVAARLIQPVELTPEQFVSHYENGQLQYEFGADERYEIVEKDGDQAESTAVGSATDGGVAVGSVPDHHVVIGDTALELAPPAVLDTDGSLDTIEKPTMTPGGTLLVRQAPEVVSPLGVRWCGSASRKQDWMTSLTPFTAEETNGDLSSIDQPGAALASLIDHLMEATAPTAFQVVVQRRASWQSDAEVRKEDLIDGRDTFFQEIVGSLLEVENQRSDQDERQLSESVEKRIESIDAKNAKRSFTVNIRAVGVPTDDIEEAAPVASTKLVSEQLLPQGRSFGLSMGLVMQFPEQVRNRNERAYDEVLNNIKTKLIGNISIERDLAESLAHEDLSPTELRNRINTLPSGEWIAQLPSPSFGETGPAPFSLKPLPIAPGHPEGDQPLTEPQVDHFESVPARDGRAHSGPVRADSDG